MENVYVTPDSDSSYVELSRTKSGRLFEKQLLPLGRGFVHPNDPTKKIVPTREMLEKMVANFEKGYCDIVQFPVANDKNQHVENPLSNLGEIIGLTLKDDGLYATIDVRKNAEDINQTILGASAMFAEDYRDTATGAHVGPTLLHVAATNRPYVTNLAPFTPIVEDSTKLSAADDNKSDDSFELVRLSREDTPEVIEVVPEETPEQPPVVDEVTPPSPEDDTKLSEDKVMDKDELIKALKDLGVDVESLQAKAAEADEAKTALSRLQDEHNVALSNVAEGEEKYSTVAEALVELSNTVKEQQDSLVALTKSESALRKQRAEAEIDGYIREGRVLPKSRDFLVQLSMDGNREALDALVPTERLVALSNESGYAINENPDTSVADDINRYVTEGNSNLPRGRRSVSR